MSLTYFSLGHDAVKSCSSRSGATGLSWFDSVVTLNFFAYIARKPRACMRRSFSLIPWITLPKRDRISLPER